MMPTPPGACRSRGLVAGWTLRAFFWLYFGSCAMLQVSWLLLLHLGLAWPSLTLLQAPSLAPHSAGHPKAQHKENEFKSVPSASPTTHPNPVLAFFRAHLPPLTSLTQRTQPKHGHLRVPRSLSLLPQTSHSQMHRSSRDKPPSSNGTSIAKTTCPPVLVLLDSVDSDLEQGKQPNVSCQTKPTCVIKEVKIHSTRNQRPLKIIRNTDLTLQGHVSYDCPDSTAKVYGRWQYLPVPHLGDVPDWTKRYGQQPFLLTTSPTPLTVDKMYFTLGVFIFNFSVSIIRSSELPVLVASDILYVIVERPSLKAILVGSQNLTVTFKNNITLDGSTSSDPELGKPISGLIFTWYCTTNPNNYQGEKIIVMSKEVCSPEQTTLRWPDYHDPVLHLMSGTLAGDRIYFFRMMIERGVRSAFADKLVHVLRGPKPESKILCIENCGVIFITSERFSLFLNCTDCTLTRDVYEWSILSPTGESLLFDWNDLTQTGRNMVYLSVKAFAFRYFLEEQYYISVRLAAWSGTVDVLRYPFFINNAPVPGDCKISPDAGIALATKFVVQCSDFQDKSTPLTYKVIVSDSYNLANISSLDENTMGGISYFGPESSSSFFLPVGDLSNQYSLKLYVQVYDTYGSYSQVTLVTTVLTPTENLSSETVLQQLHNLTMGSNSIFSELIQKKDFLGAGYLIYVAASVLNSMKSDSIVEDDTIILREHLVNQTFELPLNTLEEITQIVATLTKLTQSNTVVTVVSQERSTERISQANQALQQYRKKNTRFRSEQIDTVCTGILTSLSHLLNLTADQALSDDPIYVTDSLADTILTSLLPSNETRVLQSPGINMYFKKTIKWNASKVTVQKEDRWNDFHATVHLGRTSDLPGSAPISTAFIVFSEDPFPWLSYPENISTEVVGFRTSGEGPNGDELQVIPDVEEIFLARKTLSSEAFSIIMGPKKNSDGGDDVVTTTGAFRFQIDCNIQKEVLVHFITEVTLLFMVSVYAGGNLTDHALVATYLVPHDIPPLVHQNDWYDSNCSVKAARVVCLSTFLLQVIAERVQSTDCVIAVVLQAPRFVLSPSDKLVRISVFRDQCVDKFGIQSEWNEDTCTNGEKSTWQRVHCVCKPKGMQQPKTTPTSANLQQYSHYLAAKVITVPISVDLHLDVVKSISHNPVTLFVIIFIMITYIGLAFWALHRDETDQFLRHRVIILPDNDPYDKTCYLVTVFTGSRCGSGTTANVFVQLQGTEGVSDVHCLSHPYFTTLYRGSINTFLLTTKSVLGNIHSIRVWHDNEGKSPKWYLSRIKVENLFSRQIWLFMCRKWISVDTALHRTFNVSQPDKSVSKTDFFLIDATYRMWKNHMWFSIFVIAIDKPFKRLQRLSCSLTVFLSSLMCISIFLNLDSSGKKVSPQQKFLQAMIIGMYSVLITLPIQVIITAVFIYSQRNPLAMLKEVTPRKHPHLTEESDNWGPYLEKWYEQEINESGKETLVETVYVQENYESEGITMVVTSDISVKTVTEFPDADLKNTNTNADLKNTNTNASADVPVIEPTLQVEFVEIQTVSRFVLPSCFVYFAWFLIFAICSISCFVIVFYGQNYDYERTVKWLLASFCAFFLSVFLVEPVKIFLISAFKVHRNQYCKNLSWVSSYRYTEISLDKLNFEPSRMACLHKHIDQLQQSRRYQPITR